MRADGVTKRTMASALFCVSMLAACGSSDSGTYTLYRSSPISEGLRVHVATFDSAEGVEYNRDNCQRAADLFGRQRAVINRFWCEQGRFRP